MKSVLRLFFLLLYIQSYAQSGLVSGNYSVSAIPTNNGNGTFDITGNFTDPKGQYFASDVASGMVFWKGNHFYLIQSVLSVSGSTLAIRVQDTYTTGFIPTGIAQIVELTANLALPGVSTTGDSNPALATPPDYAALMNYLIQRIDNVFGSGSGLDLDSLVDLRLTNTNLELELVSGQVLSQSLASIDTDTSAFRTIGGTKQDLESGFAYRTGNTTIGVVDSNTHKFRVDGSFQFNPESGSTFDFQEGSGILGPVTHKGLVYTSNLSNFSGSWPPADGANLTLLRNATTNDRALLGSISFSGLDDQNQYYNGAGIIGFANGNWIGGTGLGTSINIYATNATETFARNVATFQGDGRLELDRYPFFDDPRPLSLIGYDPTDKDLTRHIIDGDPVNMTIPVLKYNNISMHFDWMDLDIITVAQSTTQRLSENGARIIIISGQSNAEGTGINAEADPADLLQQNHVLIYNTGVGWEPLNIGAGNNHVGTLDRHGIELGLAKHWQEFYPNDTLYIIKAAVSGSPISCFTGDATNPAFTFCKDSLFNEYERAMEALVALGKEPYVQSLIWAQGESGENDYEHRLSQLFRLFRNQFGEGLRIISPLIRNNQQQVIINPQFRRRALADPRFDVIESAEYPGYDNSHWTAESLRRIANNSLEIMVNHPALRVAVDSFPQGQYIPKDLQIVKQDSAIQTIDFSVFKIQNIDLAGQASTNLAFENTLNGERYTLQLFNNSGEVFLPSNLYGIAKDSLLTNFLALTDQTFILDFYRADTAFYLISPQYTLNSTLIIPIQEEYQMVLDYATNNGITLPSAAQQEKQNLLIYDLKQEGAWNDFACFFMWVNDGSPEFSLINWKDTTLNATSTAIPIWAANQGFTGGGSTFIETNFAPSAANTYNALSCHVLIGIEQAASSGNFDIGNNGTPNLIFDSDLGTNYWTRFNTTVETLVSNSGNTSGLFLMNQGASANLYRNGVQVAPITAGGSEAGGTVQIFSHAGADFSNSRQSVFAAGADIADHQLQVYTAINKYLSNP